MKITTQRDMIRAVATRWRKQYEPFADDRPIWRGELKSPPRNKRQIADLLDVLDGESATPDDVFNIIGNSSWTRLSCNECGKETDAVLIVGEPQDYESRTASLCFECVKKAADLITLPKS
jgi:hypothetical protein